MKLKIMCVGLLAVNSGAFAQFNNNIHGYLWANYNQYNGNFAAADTWYTYILNNNSSIYSYKGYIQYLHETGNHQAIVRIMNTVKNNFDNDCDVQVLFAHALRATGNTQAADDLFIKLSYTFKTHIEIVFEVAKIYVTRKELHNALQVIDSLLNNAPQKNNFYVFYFLKSQIYAELNEYPKALESIDKTVELHPYFDKGWLLLGVLNEQKGQLERAITGYTHYIETTTEHNQAVKQRLLALTVRSSQAKKNIQALLVNKSCYEKALILFERQQYSSALVNIDSCLEKKPHDLDAQILKIQILHAMRSYQDAVNTVLQWVSHDKNNISLLSMLHMLARCQAPQSLIINAFEKVHQQDQDNVWPTLYLADLYTRNNMHSKALTYYEKADALVVDASLRAKINFHQAAAYYEQKEFVKMINILEAKNEAAYVFAPSLNLLAYYYATEKKELKKAQQLIDKALALYPKNPHFLDTQAVIFYKNKQYERAHHLLVELIKQIPYDALVLIHCAQTQHKLGNTQKALATVRIAQQYAHTAYEKSKVETLIRAWEVAT